MKVNELRDKFLTYFEKHGHAIVPSSSTVPANDPTLLFTNAGMVQFKDYFLGRAQCNFTNKKNQKVNCVTSSQCCIRAGGKHNDLENVGYTARHHTFFEMLGNFSFGDYFKREAIQFAWRFLTEELKISPKKLWVTVYEEDDEAAQIWLNELGIDSSRFSRCGTKDNFWSMGDTGPCGPCSEIFYDHGPEVPGGPPGSEEQEGDRYIEIWNLVFMQYERTNEGKLVPLPKTAVDTGMGLERISAVMQNVHSNYDIDLFQNLIKAASALLNIKDNSHQSLKVIADHIRATSFLIKDGVIPANEGRGYVLRRIIRRALRHGYKLGAQGPFFYNMVKPLVENMGASYPELIQAQNLIENLVLKEEEQFLRTLESGMSILEVALNEVKNDMLSGEVAFKLYDTYGFPLDLTADIARERNISIDEAGFNCAMEKQRSRARKANQFGHDYTQEIKLEHVTTFTGYDKLKETSHIEQLIKDNQDTSTLAQGEYGGVILTHTPFYAESGGQVGDKGVLKGPHIEFIVEDTYKVNESIVHYGYVAKGELSKGIKLELNVDYERRQKVALNHSATHLLHAALRVVLGQHVSQKGSLVSPERLRFDFTHFNALSEGELYEIEHLVNKKIRENLPVEVEVTHPDIAQKKGAMALFGEKYGNEVRMLSMGDFSLELCGGTHVKRTGDIGIIKLISETGIASGVRRIEAITGQAAIEHIQQDETIIKKVLMLLKTDKVGLSSKISELMNLVRQLEKESQVLKQKVAQSSQVNWKEQAKLIGKIRVLALEIPDVDSKLLRNMVDDFKSQYEQGVVVLATINNGKVNLVAGVTPTLTQKFSAKRLVDYLANQVGGKGGGRPDLAQAGGDQPEHLQQALNSVIHWTEEQM